MNEQILDKSLALNDLILKDWLNNELLSPQWWLIVILVIISYALFFYLVDKKRITEILLFGSLVGVAFVVYDTTGHFFGYWASFIHVLPVYPNFFGSNLTLIPLHSMLIYQYTSSRKSFYLLYLLMSVIFIFGYYNIVLESLKVFSYEKPFAVFIDFVLFFIVGIIAREIMVFLFKVESRNGNKSSEYSLSKLISQNSSSKKK